MAGRHPGGGPLFERAAAYADECEFADPGVRQGLDAGLAEAYVAEGRVDDAQQISGWLREIGERLGRPRSPATRSGSTPRPRRRLATWSWRPGRPSGRWRRTSRHRCAPNWPAACWPWARSNGGAGPARRSRGALSRARDLAREMGHQPLLARIERELPRVAAARSGPELTVTEQRVAELIAAGATNREAAAELFVSVRTVETHVAAIYRKLGVRTRAELANRLSGTSAR